MKQIKIKNKILADIAEKNNIEHFRGSEEDKLGRVLGAAKNTTLTSLSASTETTFSAIPNLSIRPSKPSFVRKPTTSREKICRWGPASHGIKVDSLKKICEIKDEIDTEVYGGYFTETGLFKVEYLDIEDRELRHSEIRMTLDYPEDRILQGSFR